ncbi:BTB/POZ domain-containing protein At4g08455-like [Prunus avium]|uniref:BTB/POZ domain-containing protein At4g08455-like n=1 Tax=Prunus avium TaxID=42229 RepID=A0A6P5TE33_PRUAV|nr:BTB/POZ domain-containing protein At4g08455-like [Prunus avium]
MADKYQVQHLKDLCQKFLLSNLNWDNSLSTYTFVHQHNAKQIIDLALTLITSHDNMDKLTTREEYDVVTCKKCHEDLKAKVAFLTTSQPDSFSDIVLFASDGGSAQAAVPIPAHKAVLVSRSPVFNAMLENEMEESLSGTIKIRDVSYGTLRAFVDYLYTAEVVCLDQQLACDLLVMAEKYQVHHLKDLCQKFLVANLNWENSFLTYTFVHQHNAKKIIDAALTLIIVIDNMDKLTAREEYAELKEKDPQLVFEIYEAYLSKQVNKAAAQKGSSASYPPKYNWRGTHIEDDGVVSDYESGSG